MKLYIRFMVSLRCKLIAKEELTKLKLQILDTDLGVVEIREDITKEQRELLTKRLLRFGMELLDDTRSSLIKKIENETIDLIYEPDPSVPTDFADALTKKLGYQPELISSLFAEVRGISLKQFIIIQKVERAKELLLYDELTTAKISALLKFRSREDLVYQFKKITGLTPSFFKVLKQKRKSVAKLVKGNSVSANAKNKILG
ncbi:MAG: helix-turn-helix domain-containing protein [Cyclobacteriaceae bacterium]|nr:helix-turn-helix domain-containing protein [Cyclobacteriaceae bacterium]